MFTMAHRLKPPFCVRLGAFLCIINKQGITNK